MIKNRTEEDKARFDLAREKVMSAPKNCNSIGTYYEKTLHSVLKHYLESDESLHEVRYKGFIADIKNDGIIEIQTRGFAKMRKKLGCFLLEDKTTVVFPIHNHKWLSWIDLNTGEASPRRKSPKKGVLLDCFNELYAIKQWLTNPNLIFHVIIMDMLEYRYLNGWSENKKRGSSRCDRVPLELIGEILVKEPSDYLSLLPENLPDDSTSTVLAKAANASRGTARTALNVMSYVGAIEKAGKEGNNIIYRISK